MYNKNENLHQFKQQTITVEVGVSCDLGKRGGYLFRFGQERGLLVSKRD